MKYFFLLLYLSVPGILYSQQIEFQSLPLAGKEIRLYYFFGSRVDSLSTTIDTSGKAEFVFPDEEYLGMAALMVPGYGGIELTVGEPNIRIECPDLVFNDKTARFLYSEENQFLYRVFSTKNRYLRQKDWLEAGGVLFDEKASLLSVIRSEQSRLNDSIVALNKETEYSPLYAARYFQLVDFMDRLFEAEQESDAEKANLIRREMEDLLDITSLYHSGRLWENVLNFYINMFNRVDTQDKQQEYATSVLCTIQRLSAPYYEAFLSGCISETERFGWKLAQDSILSGLTPLFVPVSENLRRIWGRYKAEKGISMSLIEGLNDTDKEYFRQLIFFFDSGCGKCHKELKNLISLYPDLESKGVRLISISSDTDKEQYTKLIRNFPWMDKLCDFGGFSGANFSNYTVIGTPSFYLLDKENRLLGLYFSVSDFINSEEYNELSNQ